MKLRITGLLAACTTLALAAPAAADSISFIRGGDIWVATPDGARQVRITQSGGYSYQSQADDGTFIALAGRRLHRIDRAGHVLADFSTPVSGEKVHDDTSYFMGPFDPEISPDGTRVTYSYLWQSIYNKPGCTGYDWLCQERHLFQGVGYSAADRLTGWEEPGFGRQSGWVHPSWMGNGRVLLSTPSEPLNLDVMYDDVGSDNNDIHDWFSDSGAAGVRDGEANRQQTMLAFVTSEPGGEPSAANRATLYRTTGAPPSLPEPCFSLGPAAGSYEGPTWSPAGDRIAFVDRAEDETGKVLVADVPDLAGGCRAPAGAARVTIEDARHPDWGPAGVPAVAAPPQPGVDEPVVPKPRVATRALTLRGRRLARALRHGTTVTYPAPAAGRVSARALRGGRVIARGAATASGAGRLAVRLRFTKRARHALRGRRSVRLAVRITFRVA